ncbi:hypothetical protein N0V93_004424 [Gnomoniopsis smithogilvyi]|uniref:Uncharacterized protein n=1 Tax=Gnomoniopsis smithogilvyi TaxID=1191159 RepID=A0A9W8YSL7_9PEZI|nr:hypothetical protein N0V93_004424 [Gnomoniopsis smithogilvyi]
MTQILLEHILLETPTITNLHVPTSLVKPLQLRLNTIPISIVRVAAVSGAVPHVVVILALSAIATTTTSGRISRFTKATSRSYLRLTRGTRRRSQRTRLIKCVSELRKLRDCLARTFSQFTQRSSKSADGSHAPPCTQSTSRQCPKTSLASKSLCFTMLVDVSKAAPIHSTGNAVACGQGNVDVSTDCPIQPGVGLTPGAKALIASCLVIVPFVFIVAVVGVPQVWKKTKTDFVNWNATRRGFCPEECRSSTCHDDTTAGGQESQNTASVQAIDGSIDSSVVSVRDYKKGGLWRWLRFRFLHLRLLRLSQRQGHSKGTELAEFTQNMQTRREEALIEVGTRFEDVTFEIPGAEELDALDLVQSSDAQGHVSADRS